MPGCIGGDEFVERQGLPLLAGDGCLMDGAAEVHVAVQHHGPGALGKQAGIPKPEPGAIRNAVVVQFFVAQPADAARAHGARSGGWAGVRARRIASGVYLEQKARAQEDAHPQRSDPADSAARGLSGQKGRW